MTKRLIPLPQPAVDDRYPPTKTEIHALRAFTNGKASEHQQGIVLDLILHKLAAVGAQSFRKDDALGMAFMEGRRFVGSQLVTIAAIDTTSMKDDA